MKLIIDIDENVFTRLFDNGREDYTIVNDDLYAIAKSIRNGTPLDDVIGMIDKAYDDLDGYDPYALGEFANMVSDILDNIGKESEDT